MIECNIIQKLLLFKSEHYFFSYLSNPLLAYQTRWEEDEKRKNANFPFIFSSSPFPAGRLFPPS